MDFSVTVNPELIVAFVALFVLELVLGIDNVVFLSILASKLPQEQQAKARSIGLTLAMLMRIILLFFAAWIIGLTEVVFTLFGIGFSWSEMLLLAGGGFLIYKAVTEIHLKLEGEEEHAAGGAPTTFRAVITQIVLLDIVFSLDSVITAVGMVSNVWVIAAAVIISFAVMLFASKYIFQFVNAHPTVKMLALAFLVMVGAVLVAEGLGIHVNKSLIYAAMAFAIAVETLNLLVAANRRRKVPSSGEQNVKP
jgi:predicted tellurium resistance membrane protein TerC